MTTNPTQAAALLALLTQPPQRWSWPDVARAVLTAGDAVRVLNEHTNQPSLLPNEQLATATATITAWQAEGLNLVTVLDQDYPRRLRDILQIPPLLFTRGQLTPQDEAVSVVGSREATTRGLQIAANIATALTQQRITVVSGLAKGIDTAAHRAALAAGGRTVAVIGTGIRRHYPAANRGLQEEIATKGLVLSQFLPDAPPQSQNFPMRNAIMSGYGIATVVVEASENSGARIQARLAIAHGRPVILTDQVVDNTQWGKALLGQPRVYTASSLNDVLHAIDYIRADEHELGTIAAALAPHSA